MYTEIIAFININKNCIIWQMKGRMHSSYPTCGQPQVPAWAGLGGTLLEAVTEEIKMTGHPVPKLPGAPASGLQQPISPPCLPVSTSCTSLAGFATLSFCPGGLYLSTVPRDRRDLNFSKPTAHIVQKNTKETWQPLPLKEKHWFASLPLLT